MEYIVEITEVLVGKIKVNADNLKDAIKQVEAGYEDAGEPENKLSALQTEEMTARIIYGKREKTIRLI